MQTVIPMIAYTDGAAALLWLCCAFGFTETLRISDANGQISHGELRTELGGVITLATVANYQGPRRHRENCETARAWQNTPWVVDGILVYVTDVDTHYARAAAEGADILTTPEDGFPGRRYRAEDVEGHRWMFIQRENSSHEENEQASSR